MKKYISRNCALNGLLADKGISLTCNESMDIIISDEDAERIPHLVEEYAPAAKCDYGIEECDE